MMRRLRSAQIVRSAVAGAALLVPACATNGQEGDEAQGDPYRRARLAMVELIEARGVRDSATLAAMRLVPRHEFVPAPYRDQAYRDHPLPIGYDQTISQPYIVALMTDLARTEPGDRVLEVGTGSGYQAAVMAHLANSVYTIEIIEPLGKQATERLRRLGYANVQVRVGDGYHGWPEHAPYDAILVTAAAGHITPPLVRQLKPGGRMVIPVGAAFMVQQLMLVEKKADGAISTRQIMPVRFVPLTGTR
jgi:protein-L-isoaspartate(D-aspartate) O-methyltransferase